MLAKLEEQRFVKENISGSMESALSKCAAKVLLAIGGEKQDGKGKSIEEVLWC